MQNSNAVKQEKLVDANTRRIPRRVPQKVRELVAKAKYKAPQVISFPLDETKGGSKMPQITMAGNF